MEYDLNFLKMKDNLNQTWPHFFVMEDNLNFFENGRRPWFILKIEDDLNLFEMEDNPN